MPDDAERVRAVREAVGPWPAIRVDANGAWTPDQAVAALEELAPLDLELVEQPCATLEELAEVRARVSVTVAADESIAGADDVHRAAALAACDAVNVKLAAAGGYGPARDALRAAREHHLAAWLSSTLDGPWGIAAALQLASSANLGMACGLATLELFDARAGTLPARPVERADGRAPGARAWAWRCQPTLWPKFWSRKSASSRATAAGCWSWGAWPACSTISARPSGSSRAIRRAASE